MASTREEVEYVCFNYRGNSSTSNVGAIEDGSLDQAIRDFRFYNKNTFFLGGINYCRECNIIHPSDKCPRCEEPNFFFDDELLLRIDGLREAESIWREGWEMKIKKLEEEVEELHVALRLRRDKLGETERRLEEAELNVEKLKNQKRLLLGKIKELLAMPHLRHIIFDEEKL